MAVQRHTRVRARPHARTHAQRYEVEATEAYRQLLDVCADSIDVLQHYHLFLKVGCRAIYGPQ